MTRTKWRIYKELSIRYRVALLSYHAWLQKVCKRNTQNLRYLGQKVRSSARATTGSSGIPASPWQRQEARTTSREHPGLRGNPRTLMCERFDRQEELDSYLSQIIEMATDFGGSLFYEYHKLFSAKAATVLHNNGIKLDWSIRDTDLYCRLCAGRRVNACTLCSSVAHSTGMCPLASSLKTPSAGLNKRNADGVNDAVGRQRKFHAGVEICNNYNSSNGCNRRICKFLHLCSWCKSEQHCGAECLQRQRQTGKGTTNTSATAKDNSATVPELNSRVRKKWLVNEDPNSNYGVVTPNINVKNLRDMLQGCPDADFQEYLLPGAMQGFETGMSCFPTTNFKCKNSLSARQDPNATSELLLKEVEKGYVIGPFDEPPFESFRINPISLATKKYSNKKRLVVDMSAPHDDPDNPSINALISKEDFRLSYVKFDEAIAIVQQLGRGTQLCKTWLTRLNSYQQGQRCGLSKGCFGKESIIFSPDWFLAADLLAKFLTLCPGLLLGLPNINMA